MQVASIAGERFAQVVERPDPTPTGEFVLVKVLVAPMCTEYKSFVAGRETDNLGHEAAGEVVAVEDNRRVKVGDRVVVQPQYACGVCALCLRGDHIHCQNGRNLREVTGSTTGRATMAQYLLKQDWLLSPIPDDVSTEHASMACCGLGPTFGAMQALEADAFDTVLITGMGPVGLGGVVNGVHRGARVIAVESHPYRKQLASDLGAATVIEPGEDALAQVLELTGGRGADKAIDCSGSAEAQRLLIDATRRRGKVAFVGEAGELTIAVSRDMIRKGLTLVGNWHYNLADYPRLIEVIRARSSELDKLITHVFPQSRVQDAWELQTTGNCGKVILKPWEDDN